MTLFSSRRQFLKQSAIVSASAWIARSSWAQSFPQRQAQRRLRGIGTANPDLLIRS